MSIILVLGTTIGPLGSAEAKSVSPVTSDAQLNNLIVKLLEPTPAPGWDEFIKPQLIRAEEQRIEAVRQTEIARLKAIEDARIEAERIEAERLEAERVTRPKSFGTYGNSYAYGFCTFYVASRKNVPSYMGDARNWYSAAMSYGMAVGSTPRVGAVAHTYAGYYGHVALVEAVNGTQVLVSEMNWNGGWNRISQRWTSAYDWNYIY